MYTPGHADFIAEVERALRALDGVVLVISAVEGVQAQTRVLMRTSAKLGLPTLIFANKIDRTGARDGRLMAEIREKLTARAVALTSVVGIGTAGARTVERPLEEIGEFLADADDAFLVRYLDDAVKLDEAGYRSELARQDGFFAPPSLESVVTPLDPARTAALFTALEQLAEADPYIGLRRDDATRAISVRLYGEVQKEVIQTTLAEEFAIEVEFSQTRTIYIERLKKTGSWVQERQPDEGIFDWATVGLRIEPAAPGSGVSYGLEVELGALPLSFHTAIEESVRKRLLAGPHGWEITDCRVTVIQTAFFPPASTAGHFRTIAALALDKAIRRAGTEVCEPVNRFELDVPTDSGTRVLPRLIALRAVPDEPQVGPSIWRLTGTIPAGRIAAFEQELRGLTHGEGVFISEFDSYRPC